MSKRTDAYQPPVASSRLSADEASDIKHRDIAVFVLLNIVTLGIYWLYVCFCWSKEVNGLLGRAKYQPWIVLVVNIVTCGTAGLVFEVLFAIDIGQSTQSRGVPGRMEQLSVWVIVLNVVAMIASATGVGVVIGFPLGLLASVLVQIELNKFESMNGVTTSFESKAV